MSSVSFKDFENERGDVNWAAYEKAQVANGDKCSVCGAHIMWGGKGHSERCHQCKSMQDDGSELDHDNLLRCPRCGHSWNPGHDDDEWAVYSDDTHDVCCSKCDYDFEITTTVSYSFTSPARIDAIKCEACDEYVDKPGLCADCKKR